MTSKVRSSKRNLETTESKGKGKKGAMKPRDVHQVGIEIDRDEEEEVNGKTTNLSEEVCIYILRHLITSVANTLSLAIILHFIC